MPSKPNNLWYNVKKLIRFPNRWRCTHKYFRITIPEARFLNPEFRHEPAIGIKNRQNKNQLGFKSQIVDDQLHIYLLNHRQNKNKLDFKNQKIG